MRTSNNYALAKKTLILQAPNKMRKSLSILIFSISFAFLTGCGALTGEEVARLPVNQVSTDDNNLIIKETTLDLKKDQEVAIWSDMDIAYEGDVALRFKMEILKNGAHYSRLEIDPTDKNITIGELKTSVMGKTDWSFSGKNSEMKIEEDAKYTFKAILVASENPTLKVTKAEIVLKQ